MKFDFTLTPGQQALAEANLKVIDKVISRYIHTDEGVCGLGWDDLYQEGAMALCKAAATYDGTSAQFSTYATTVIRNHLFNHCKAANTRQRNLPAVSLDLDRLGVEALELKVKGLSGSDIARLYGAKPNQVGAWISRAAQKIRKDIAERV